MGARGQAGGVVDAWGELAVGGAAGGALTDDMARGGREIPAADELNQSY